MFLTLVIFITILALLVLAHEFGHFIVARKNGIKVEEFGFGFPPRIFGAQILRGARLEKLVEKEEVKVLEGEGQEIIVDEEKEIDILQPFKQIHWLWGNRGLTEEEKQKGAVYSLNLIPLGGFVKIKGENGDFADEPDSFGYKKIWQRALVLVAGVTMNFILAALLLGIGFLIGLPQSLDTIYYGAKVREAKIEVMSILPASPAAGAGLAIGDELLKVDDLSIQKVSDLQDYVDVRQGQSVQFTFQRGAEVIIKEIVPVKMETTKRGGIGVALLESGIVSYPWYLAFVYGFSSAGVFVWEVLRAIWFLFVSVFQGRGGIAENLSGPVGIAVLTGRVARLGFSHLLQFAAMLSINLAILNILPFPALDGGRVLFLAIEKLRGRPLRRKVEEWAHTVGFALLMVLVIFVTYKDVIKFSSGFIRLGRRLMGG